MSLTQTVRNKPIPAGLALVLGTETRILESFSRYSASIYALFTQKRGSQVQQSCLNDSAQLAQMGVWILVSIGKHPRIHLKDHTRYNQDPKMHGIPRRMSLLVGEAQLAGCLKVWVGGSLEWDAGIQWQCERCQLGMVINIWCKNNLVYFCSRAIHTFKIYTTFSKIRLFVYFYWVDFSIFSDWKPISINILLKHVYWHF